MLIVATKVPAVRRSASCFGLRRRAASVLVAAAVLAIVSGCRSSPPPPRDPAPPPPDLEAVVSGAGSASAPAPAGRGSVPYTPPDQVPGGDKPYPNLADVPPRPVVTPLAERKRLTAALIADRDKALHAAEPIPLQGSPDVPSTRRPDAPVYAASEEEPAAGAARAQGAATALPAAATARRLPAGLLAGEGLAEPTPGRPPPPPAAAQAAAKASQSPIPPAESGRALRVATIVFEKDSKQLAGSDKAILGEVAKFHKQYGGTVRLIAPVMNGDPPDKAQVGVDRAVAVANELVGLGIPQKQIVIGALDAAPEGETANRRVEILFTQ